MTAASFETTDPLPRVLNIIHLAELVPHSDGLRMQEEQVNAILAGTSGDVVFLLEHQPVYTIGRLRDTSSLGDPRSLPYPVVETNRGGQATYHGPGQLVGYPVLDLTPRGRDLHLHLRLIEEALILAVARFGITAARREGFTGVWVGDRKLASIGVGVRKWVSMHGFAINVTRQCLPPFLAITPCGLGGVRMTCVQDEAGHEVSIADFSKVIAATLRKCFDKSC